MPDITLKYSQEEIEDFIRQMLATKGLQPIGGRIEFKTSSNVTKELVVVVDCESGPFLDVCPMCQTPMENGVPIRSHAPLRPVADTRVYKTIKEEEERAVMETLPEVARDYPVDSIQEEQNSTIIDPELGETFDPPSPGEGSPSVSVSSSSDESDDNENEPTGGSMQALLAANRRLTVQRTRALAERRGQTGRVSLMPGESTRPPKPGEGR